MGGDGCVVFDGIRPELVALSKEAAIDHNKARQLLADLDLMSLKDLFAERYCEEKSIFLTRIGERLNVEMGESLPGETQLGAALCGPNSAGAAQ